MSASTCFAALSNGQKEFAPKPLEKKSEALKDMPLSNIVERLQDQKIAKSLL